MPEFGERFKVVRVQFGAGVDRYTYITEPTAKIGDKLNTPNRTNTPAVITEIGPNWENSQRYGYRGVVKYAPVLKAKYCECCGQELKDELKREGNNA